MKIVFWVVLSMIFVSCSENEQNESGMTTDRHSFKAKELALRNQINGEWRQINRNCDAQGRNCVPLTDKILWTFEENDVIWGRFTHPYNISNDTIYITGMPYRIALSTEDTLLFHVVSTNEYLQLIRK